jgi:hypothetical protein
MKKENSIKLLLAQKSKLKDKLLDERHWSDETSNLVSNIFGKDSEQYRQIREINISINDFVFAGEGLNPMKNRVRAEKCLDSFITQIENFTYESQSTFYADKEFKFNKSTIYTLMPIIISGSFALGLYFGNTKFDKEKIELNDKVKILTEEKSKLIIQLKLKDKKIIAKDNLIEVTSDSLKSTQKDLNSLYLYLGSLEKGKAK